MTKGALPLPLPHPPNCSLATEHREKQSKAQAWSRAFGMSPKGRTGRPRLGPPDFVDPAGRVKRGLYTLQEESTLQEERGVEIREGAREGRGGSVPRLKRPLVAAARVCSCLRFEGPLGLGGEGVS